MRRAVLAAALVPVLAARAAAQSGDGGELTPVPEERIVAGDAEAGRRAIGRWGCGACHRVPGVPGTIGIVGPPLDGFGARPLIAGQLPNQGDVLVRFLHDPPALVPGTGMPRQPLSPEEVRDIAAYLVTLR